jgi:hypothetical protein
MVSNATLAAYIVSGDLQLGSTGDGSTIGEAALFFNICMFAFAVTIMGLGAAYIGFYFAGNYDPDINSLQLATNVGRGSRT